MKIAINLPDFKSYRDTLLMICFIAQNIDHLYLLTNQWQEFPQDIEKPINLEIVYFPAHSFRTLATEWLYKKCIVEEQIDIVHDLFGHLCRFCEEASLLKNRKLRMLTTQRTSNTAWYHIVKPLGFNIDISYAKQRMLSLWRDIRLFDILDHIVVLGPGHDQELIDHYQVPPSKISWFPSETDLSLFKAKDHQDTLPLQVLYTGRIFRNKGIDLAIDALLEIKDLFTDLHFILIGDIPFFEKAWFDQAFAHAKKQGLKITQINHIPRTELIDYYQKSGCYLFPSLFEGSPRSVREAIACGCPAILSDIPGHRGIDANGDFVRFTRLKNKEDLKQALIAQLNENLYFKDKRQERVQKGIDALHLKHHPKTIALHYVSLYEKLLHTMI